MSLFGITKPPRNGIAKVVSPNFTPEETGNNPSVIFSEDVPLEIGHTAEAISRQPQPLDQQWLAEGGNRQNYGEISKGGNSNADQPIVLIRQTGAPKTSYFNDVSFSRVDTIQTAPPNRGARGTPANNPGNPHGTQITYEQVPNNTTPQPSGWGQPTLGYSGGNTSQFHPGGGQNPNRTVSL